jgi:HAMP domain-containing protein
MWATTSPLNDAMSAVNTGMPARFAARTPAPIPLESTGQTTTASTPRVMKSSI